MVGVFFLWLIVALILLGLIAWVSLLDINEGHPIGETLLLSALFGSAALAWPITLPLGLVLYVVHEVRKGKEAVT